MYIISYYDVRKPIIVFFFFCHYDCSLLKILPSFPELVCNYKFCSKNTKKKIRATGAQIPHSINMMHCSGCVFTVCVCVHCCVCALGWVKCRAQIPSMGHHTWSYVTALSLSINPQPYLVRFPPCL